MYKRTKLRKQLRVRRLLRELKAPALCIAYAGAAVAVLSVGAARMETHMEEAAAKAEAVCKVYTTEADPEALPTAGIARALWEPEVVPVQLELAKEPEETETTEETKDVAEEDIELLAHLIFAEVGSIRDDACLYACGSVILNRVASEDFPDTIYDVIYQTEPMLQYACTVNGAMEKTPDDRCMEIAEDLLRNGTSIPADVVYMAEFTQGSGVYAIYENVVFCYE